MTRFIGTYFRTQTMHISADFRPEELFNPRSKKHRTLITGLGRSWSCDPGGICPDPGPSPIVMGFGVLALVPMKTVPSPADN